MAHLRLSDADDAIRRRPLANLGAAALVGDDVVAQDLGQQPADAAHLDVVALLYGQLQRRLRISTSALSWAARC